MLCAGRLRTTRAGGDAGGRGRCGSCARPEPVEAVAPVPDDPPVLFRWRRVVHRVRRADGPERIGGEWWRDTEEAERLRDYYRSRTRRAGASGSSATVSIGRRAPRWFLHGVFA